MESRPQTYIVNRSTNNNDWTSPFNTSADDGISNGLEGFRQIGSFFVEGERLCNSRHPELNSAW